MSHDEEGKAMGRLFYVAPPADGLLSSSNQEVLPGQEGTPASEEEPFFVWRFAVRETDLLKKLRFYGPYGRGYRFSLLWWI